MSRKSNFTKYWLNNFNYRKTTPRYRGINRLLATSKTLVVILLTMSIFLMISINISIPKKLVIVEGEEYSYKIPTQYFGGDIKANTHKIETCIPITQNLNANLYFNNSIDLLADDIGNYEVQLSLFDLFPIKKMDVEILPKKEIIPCGNAIVVKIENNWITVVDLDYFYDSSNNKVSPAKKAGVMPRDKITKINDQLVFNVNQMSEIVKNCNGNPLTLKVERNSQETNITVTPIMDKESKSYKLGLWIRDGMTGIGTLTFYDDQSNKFMALGHSISENNQDLNDNLQDSSIIEAKVVDIKKGEPGNPGELIGNFGSSDDKLGVITSNTDVGISGKIIQEQKQSLSNVPFQIGSGISVKEGIAHILSTLSDSKVEKFEVEIKKVNKLLSNSNKDMIIQVKDQNLLDKTGGIVQGMSGSPIIQGDKIIGAVTHVFVNDPKRGYGVFVDKMIRTSLS